MKSFKEYLREEYPRPHFIVREEIIQCHNSKDQYDVLVIYKVNQKTGERVRDIQYSAKQKGYSL